MKCKIGAHGATLAGCAIGLGVVAIGVTGGAAAGGILPAVAAGCGASIGATKMGMSIAKLAEMAKGYTSIAPGSSWKTDGYTLSLLQEAHCVEVVPLPDGQVAPVSIKLSPIFSGPTADSTNVYKIREHGTVLGG